ncbi:MAG: hypothetical protein KAS38_03135 [Anaerolineales bacterium]|nr:hypothetical protein [Anaerolineales bacterium]MCK4976157.1 hypothetical protein [Anaerolineales bacterium]
MEEKTICCECDKVISETKCPNCTGQSMCIDCGKKYVPKEVFDQWFGEDDE